MVPGYGYINIASANINISRNLTVLIRSYLSVLQRLPGLVWWFITSRRFNKLVIGFNYNSLFWLKVVGGEERLLKASASAGRLLKGQEPHLRGMPF